MQLLSVILLAAALTTTTVKLPSGKILKVEVATEGDDIAKALRGRESLPEESGLLIAYKGDVQTQDNLMGYRLPVDLFFIDEMKTVINLKENAVPCRTPECRYPSTWPYRYQLQVPAGTARRLNIHAGDVLSFNVPGFTSTTTPKTNTSPPAKRPVIKLTVP
jgi:uncharacterized membrane protein (UPF0127 family)